MPRNQDDVDAILNESNGNNVFIGMHSLFGIGEYVSIKGKYTFIND